MNLPIIVIGAGGHARVLISVLQTRKMKIMGITDLEAKTAGDCINGISVLGQDNMILEKPPDSILLVNGIGSVGSTLPREAIYKKFKSRGYSFAAVIHPAAMIMDEVKLGEGVQIMAGAIVQTGCRIGDNTIINTGAVVDHDCIIGDHVHVAPGAVLSGGVQVGDRTHLGTAAVVIQEIEIGDSAIVGAGAVVIKNIAANVKVAGNPAREVGK